MELVTLISSSQILPSSFDDDAWMIAAWSATGRPAPQRTGSTPSRIGVAASARPTVPTARLAQTSFRQRVIQAIERARLLSDTPTFGHG
jgi:hypothetical protein